MVHIARADHLPRKEGRKEGSKLLASVGAREPWRETRVKPVNTDLGVKNYCVQLTATPRGL